MSENVLHKSGIVEGMNTGIYITDEQGIRYIDCYSSASTFNLGRRNERLIRFLKEAIHETDQGNFLMISEEKALLARRISEFIPGPLDCVLFGVTRGESMDAACKLARGATGRSGLITVDGGYFGDTGFALSLSQHPLKKDFGELIPGVVTIPFGNHEAAKDAISYNPAAFIIEPIQAENHCRIADPQYLKYIRELCSDTGTILIFDESQSGFGRTGKKFAFEHYDIHPDILVVGEAITGGIFPMTVAIFTSELKRFFDIHPLIHLSTFGGHDVGCVVAAATLDEYEQVKPWENALLQGTKFINDLRPVITSDERIESLQGMGLLLSLKFVTPSIANRFCLLAKKNGIFFCIGIVDNCSVLLRPSLLITDSEADCILKGIKASLYEL